MGKKKPRVLASHDLAQLSPATIEVEGRGHYQWQHHRSILEVLDLAGLPVRSSCRSGNCGACLVYLLEGEVAYTKEPGFPLEAGECLMCSCVPVGNIRLGLLSSPVPPRRRK